MKTTDRLKFEELFKSLKPTNGLVAGNKVKKVLLEMQLPLDKMGKIWDKIWNLVDEDNDGNLDSHEFSVFMHLMYKALERREVPTVVPPELKKPPKIPRAPSDEGFGDGGFVANLPKDITPPPAITRPPDLSSANTTASLISLQPDVPISPKLEQNQGASDWVVTPQDLIRFESIFRECDKDKDGLVSAMEVRNVFLQSGVRLHYLARIWSLCDTNKSDKLTLEQFALAMWLIEQKKNGIEPPQVLAPNMIPPNLKGAPGIGVVETSFSKIVPAKPALVILPYDLKQLIKRKCEKETVILQREDDLRIKSEEIKSLQSEFDTFHDILIQLESQKGEARKLLDDLRSQVDRCREQIQKQEETINGQESELNAKRNELQKLKDKENNLEKEYNTLDEEIESISQSFQDKELQISQVKAIITRLLETQRQMSDNVLLCRNAVETQISPISDYALKFEADFREAKQLLRTFEKSKTLTTSVNLIANDNGHFSGNKNTLDKAGSTTDRFNAPRGMGGFKFVYNFKNASFTTGSAATLDLCGQKKTTMSSNESGKDPYEFSVESPTSETILPVVGPQRPVPPLLFRTTSTPQKCTTSFTTKKYNSDGVKQNETKRFFKTSSVSQETKRWLTDMKRSSRKLRGGPYVSVVNPADDWPFNSTGYPIGWTSNASSTADGAGPSTADGAGPSTTRTASPPSTRSSTQRQKCPRKLPSFKEQFQRKGKKEDDDDKKN